MNNINPNKLGRNSFITRVEPNESTDGRNQELANGSLNRPIVSNVTNTTLLQENQEKSTQPKDQAIAPGTPPPAIYSNEQNLNTEALTDLNANEVDRPTSFVSPELIVRQYQSPTAPLNNRLTSMEVSTPQDLTAQGDQDKESIRSVDSTPHNDEDSSSKSFGANSPRIHAVVIGEEAVNNVNSPAKIPASETPRTLASKQPLSSVYSYNTPPRKKQRTGDDQSFTTPTDNNSPFTTPPSQIINENNPHFFHLEPDEPKRKAFPTREITCSNEENDDSPSPEVNRVVIQRILFNDIDSEEESNINEVSPAPSNAIREKGHSGDASGHFPNPNGSRTPPAPSKNHKLS